MKAKVTKSWFYLFVGPPVINSPDTQYARYGSDGFVECDVRALPKPDSITWLKDEKPLDLANMKR